VGTNVRNYELMVILDPSIDERTVAPTMEKYLAPVAANGGSVENVDIWGKRRLAYDILKRSEGIYVVIDMTTTPEVALEINRRMGIDETILRTADMAGDTVITIIGNLTADPELRWTQSGAAVADFTVASTPRTYDRNAGEWRDGDTLFMRCSVWRDTAENVAESLRKGMRVIVQGRLTQRSYDTQQGERRTVVELQVDEVGPSLRRARAQVTRTTPSGGGGYQSDNRGQQQGGYQQAAPQGGGGYGGGQGGYGQGGANYGAPTGGSPEDPWRSAPAGGATSFGDEPPF